MADTFSVLSRELTRAERRLLLARILSTQQPAIEDEPALPPDAVEETARGPEEVYASLSGLEKLLLLVMRLFTGKPVVVLTEERQLKRLRQKIGAAAPGLVDFPSGRLTQRMRSELEGLRGVQSFFRGALFGLPDRRDFIAFLAGLELDPLNERIEQETEPRGIAEEPLAAENRTIRAEMAERLGRIIEEIPRERRATVQREVQRLRALDAFAAVRLEGTLLLTTAAAEGLAPAEKGTRLAPLLTALWAARHPPGPTAWHALFLFKSSERFSDPSFDMEKQAAAFSSRARAAHASLRAFLRRVPLLDMVRSLSEDLDYTPRPADAGESWVALFKGFWEERLETIFREFVREKKLLACVSQALSLCGLSTLPSLESYRRRVAGETLPVTHETSVGIFRGFHEAVFLTKMERHLKLVSINGDFYKEENRADFMASFEGVGAAYEACRLLDRRLSPGGDREARMAGLEGPGAESGAPVKVRAIWEEANRDARKAVEGGRASLSRLSTILYGILYGEVGGKFDTLVNLNTLGGRENRLIIKGLDSAIAYADRAVALLTESLDLEAGV